LHGLLREKLDITHEVGISRAEILDQLEQRYGREAIEALRAALDQGYPSTPLIDQRTTRHASPTAARSEADIWLEEQPKRD
jgi:hypothetical protein